MVIFLLIWLIFHIVLLKVGMHHVIILDPGVSSREPKGTYPPYDDGFKNGLFIKNESGLPLEGQVCFFYLYNYLNVYFLS